MAKESYNSQITKLNANNYSIWKFRMEMILIKEDLFDLIENEPPLQPDATFLKRDRQARALINLCIDDTQILHVKYETTSKSTWNKLKSVHERANLSSKLFLLRKLYSTKMSEDGNMIEHINQMLELVDKLKVMGEDIKDDHVAALLLVSVPKSYDNLITALEARPEMELTPDLIKNKLTDEYNRRKEQSFERSSSQVYKTNSRYNSTFSHRNNSKDERFCSHCRRYGHDRLSCFNLKNKYKNHQRKQNSKNEFQNKLNYREKSSVCHNSSNIESHDQLLCIESSYPKKINISKNKNINSNASEKKNLSFTSEITQFNGSKQSAYELRNKFKNADFIIDSGATQHLVNDKGLFSELNENAESLEITIANGDNLFTKGMGNVPIKTKTSNGIIYNVTLQNAYYLPDLDSNLISVKKITDKDFSVIFHKDKCFVEKDNKVCLEATAQDNNLYKVTLCNNEENEGNEANFMYSCVNKNCITLWHKRFGHRDVNAIKQLVKENLADGIKLDSCHHKNECVECIKNKMCEFPYPKEAKFRANKPLILIHSDLCGPMRTATFSGKYYFLTFVDDFSRFTMIYLLSHKSEVLSKFKEFVAVTRNKFGRIVKTLRSDNGKEYVNNEMEAYMKELGIRHQLTVPQSPQQNGVSERKNRSLVEMTRCLLANANLNHKFWGEAVMTANYLQNRLPTKANSKTPFQLWTSKKPDLSNIRTFGCRAFAHIHKSKRSKLEEKAVEGILMGYDNRSKGYRIYIPGKNVIISRSVKFIEDKEFKEESSVISIPHKKLENEDELPEEKPDSPQTSIENTKPEPRRSERLTKGKPPERLTYLAMKKEPNNFKEVQELNDEEKEKWSEAMREEIDSLVKNKTWELVTLPKDKKPIGCKWIFKIKLNEEGNVERYKARLVAKGYNQKFGSDYEETFAPVVKYTTMRAFLAAATYKQMHVKHIDIKTAFLYGELEEEIYMNQPEGYIKVGNEEKVYKLKKAIYGLKQAAKAWNEKLGNILKENGFKQSVADPCLFKKIENDEEILIIIYVDDILIASPDEEKINKTIEVLERKFQLKNLGDVKYYLGINIKRTQEGNFELNQRIKIEKLFENLEIKDQKPTYIPMKTSYLKENLEGKLLDNNIKYRKAIGALLHISTLTRPDISLAVNLLSRKCEKPTEDDWTSVVKVIRYLNSTKNLNLVINNESKPVLIGYTDADFANDKTSRKSTGGNIFFLGDSPISWVTKRQNCVALSSTESEYIAAAHSATEIEWLIQLLKDLELEQTLPIMLYEDNKSCIILSQNDKNSSRMKHVDIKFHYLKDLQQQQIIMLDYCNTKCMVADIFTKPLPRPQFLFLRDKLNLKT